MRKYGKLAIALGLSLVILGTAGCGKNKDNNSDETVAPEENEIIMGTDLNLADYSLVWEDNFDADKLSTADWNYEVHEPGWVNNELQEYVISDENVFLEDGKLVIKPIKTTENGTVSYTSGRVNTQGKHDFTYGVFEAKIKFPKGQGFLPAFWLMASDENIYGQWPRCGEIDIAEVLGHATKKTFGTVHYGNPHNESQGTYTLKDGDFSEEFHIFSVEWNPGNIKWFVDGNLMHEESDWYSKTQGVGEITYPAPFDQPFYMILNLAVGGNWPGNPDSSTDFDAARMEVDYVKVYQKSEYNEDVKKPVKVVTLREPDESGNYITNGDFSDETEDLSTAKGWQFLLADTGAGEAKIANNTMTITSTSAGAVDYGVQLVQPHIPMQCGAKYKITFDAWSDEVRTMKTAVTAPTAGWIRYFPDTETPLTTKKQTYTFEFTMNEEDDANGRLEFNMGNTDSTATIYIQNVRVEMTEGPGKAGSSEKTVLADGNYVYNSKFQEGEKHLGSWEITNKNNATVEVTPFSDLRRLHVVSDGDAKDVIIAQKDLGMVAGSKYLLTFDAEVKEPVDMKVTVAGKTETFKLSGTNTYKYNFEIKDAKSAKDLIMYLGNTKDILLDNVRIVEDVMIKNGSFNANFAGYEVYIDSSANASYVVDSLTEDNAADFSIKNGGGEDWKIQLKQNNVELIQGHKYHLKIDAKSSISRKIRVLLQGGEDKGWVIYSGENTITLTENFKTYELDFTMTEPTDAAAFLSVCLGNVEGEALSEAHRVVIDNISLVEVK